MSAEYSLHSYVGISAAYDTIVITNFPIILDYFIFSFSSFYNPSVLVSHSQITRLLLQLFILYLLILFHFLSVLLSYPKYLEVNQKLFFCILLTYRKLVVILNQKLLINKII